MQFLEPILGGIAAFLLGFLWYTALFGKQWQAETGISDDEAKKGMGLTHGLALVCMILMSYPLNAFVINSHDLADQTFAHGALHGALAGLFYGATATAIHYLYQKKSLKLFLIDASYTVALLALSGGIMAALHLG
jgi:hypothetical protein